jgi:hypothetical protein
MSSMPGLHIDNLLEKIILQFHLIAMTPYILNFTKSRYGDVQESANFILVVLFTSFASDKI